MRISDERRGSSCLECKWHSKKWAHILAHHPVPPYTSLVMSQTYKRRHQPVYFSQASALPNLIPFCLVVWRASICHRVSGIGRHSWSACSATWHNVSHSWISIARKSYECLLSPISQSFTLTSRLRTTFIHAGRGPVCLTHPVTQIWHRHSRTVLCLSNVLRPLSVVSQTSLDVCLWILDTFLFSNFQDLALLFQINNTSLNLSSYVKKYKSGKKWSYLK